MRIVRNRPEPARLAPIPPKTGKDRSAGGRKAQKGTVRMSPLTWDDATLEAIPNGWRFTLPVLESANRLWRNAKGRTYKAAGVVADLKAARLAFRHCVPLAGDVAVTVRWHRARRAGDLDNRTKATLDLLRGIAYADDAQVAALTLSRHDGDGPARLVVEVCPLRFPTPGHNMHP